jgi:RimJ/RimL family protein N-acetyltransferase
MWENPELQLDEILLRPWKPEDATWYVEARDAEVFRWTTERRDLTVEDAAESIKQANIANEAVCLAVVDYKTGQLLGNIALVREAGDSKSGEIMFWLATQARGRGVAVKAVRLLCQWALSELGLNSIVAKTFPRNDRSQRVIIKAGFQKCLHADKLKRDNSYEWYILTKGGSPQES